MTQSSATAAIRTLDIVIIDDMDIPAIVEAITVHEDVTIYSVRIITGDLFAREQDELTEATDAQAESFRSDLVVLNAAGSLHEALVPVKTVTDGAVITTGAVAAEIAATATATLSARSDDMLVIGLNASANMFA